MSNFGIDNAEQYKAALVNMAAAAQQISGWQDRTSTVASNLRVAPAGAVITTIPVGALVQVSIPYVLQNAVLNNLSYNWLLVQYGGRMGYVALVVGSWDAQLTAVDKTHKILAVPYKSQWGYPSARTGMCGPTSVNMLHRYKNQQAKATYPVEITPDTMSNLINLGAHEGTTLERLVELATAYGLKLSTHTGDPVSYPIIKSEIDNGRPLAVLLSYGQLAERGDQQFTGLHIMVVVGYSDQFIYTNDPDYTAASGAGVSKPYPVGEFVDSVQQILYYRE